MFKVYILRSVINGAYYVGSCKDTDIRLAQHNTGKVRSTKRYAPWHLIYTELFVTLREARQREKQIKSWKSRAAMERLVLTSKI